jgi:hypothetical protein
MSELVACRAPIRQEAEFLRGGARWTSERTTRDSRSCRLARAGIIYVDIWDGFVDEDGDYAVQGPDFEGQIRRLRTANGVHFTKAGAVKIASFVDRELRRVMPSSAMPVALPGPETTPKSGAAGARADVGPVLPLTASGDDHGGALLGAGDHTFTNCVHNCSLSPLERDHKFFQAH